MDSMCIVFLKKKKKLVTMNVGMELSTQRFTGFFTFAVITENVLEDTGRVFVTNPPLAVDLAPVTPWTGTCADPKMF